MDSFPEKDSVAPRRAVGPRPFRAVGVLSDSVCVCVLFSFLSPAFRMVRWTVANPKVKDPADVFTRRIWLVHSAGGQHEFKMSLIAMEQPHYIN